MTYSHVPVLLQESIQLLAVKATGCYIDATFGRGGHTQELLKHLGASGRLGVCDRDPEAIAVARLLAEQDQRLSVWHKPFSQVPLHAGESGAWRGQCDGILLDLGVSSPQIDNAERGFSFYDDGPLDMRMDPSAHETAATWLAQVSAQDLATVLKTLGEERFARRIAQAIVQERCHTPLVRTRQLADLVATVVPTREPGKHPATRTFQALRLQINHELDELQHFLQHVDILLKPGARLVVISFHSLEDRMIKRFFRATLEEAPPLKKLAIPTSAPTTRWRVLTKPIRPSAVEQKSNRRSRSAILRAGEWLG
jgi:16S rRNA (cytosine1402-N4)-methyltransferase